MIRKRSSRSTSTGMLRMRLPMCSWGGATSSIRSKYGLGRMCGKMSIFTAPAESDDRAGGGEGFARALHGHPHAVTGRDVADRAHVGGGGAEVAVPAVGGAHHGGAAERRGPRALLVEDLQEPRALVAVRPHPPELHAHAGDRQPARAHV